MKGQGINSKSSPETASQTAGPYVHIGLSPKAAGFEIYDQELGTDIAGPNAIGERIRIEGIVWDGLGEPLRDVLIEVWQPNGRGVFADAGEVEDGFSGWGRIVCDFESGEWGFNTIKPGGFGNNAPHLNLWIVARGINTGLNTRLYFSDEVEANTIDPVLRMLNENCRQDTLIASRSEEGDLPVYRFDIRLQGEQETVFFDV